MMKKLVRRKSEIKEDDIVVSEPSFVRHGGHFNFVDGASQVNNEEASAEWKELIDKLNKVLRSVGSDEVSSEEQRFLKVQQRELKETLNRQKSALDTHFEELIRSISPSPPTSSYGSSNEHLWDEDADEKPSLEKQVSFMNRQLESKEKEEGFSKSKSIENLANFEDHSHKNHSEKSKPLRALSPPPVGRKRGLTISAPSDARRDYNPYEQDKELLEKKVKELEMKLLEYGAKITRLEEQEMKVVLFHLGEQKARFDETQKRLEAEYAENIRKVTVQNTDLQQNLLMEQRRVQQLESKCQTLERELSALKGGTSADDSAAQQKSEAEKKAEAEKYAKLQQMFEEEQNKRVALEQQVTALNLEIAQLQTKVKEYQQAEVDITESKRKSLTELQALKAEHNNAMKRLQEQLESERAENKKLTAQIQIMLTTASKTAAATSSQQPTVTQEAAPKPTPTNPTSPSLTQTKNSTQEAASKPTPTNTTSPSLTPAKNSSFPPTVPPRRPSRPPAAAIIPPSTPPPPVPAKSTSAPVPVPATNVPPPAPLTASSSAPANLTASHTTTLSPANKHRTPPSSPSKSKSPEPPSNPTKSKNNSTDNARDRLSQILAYSVLARRSRTIQSGQIQLPNTSNDSPKEQNA